MSKLYACYATSDYYARETGISMIGFFENNPDYEPDEFFILDYGILDESKLKLDGIASRYGKIITYLPAKQILEDIQLKLNLNDFRGSLATYSRAFIDKIMPEYVDRLFYIDSDTVVTGSISELKNFDMNKECMAGIYSTVYTKAIADGKWQLVSGNQHYYGCGIVLFNLRNWRNYNCYKLIVRMLSIKKELPCADQTLINNALPESFFKKLPLKYNYTSHIFSSRFEMSFLKNSNCYSLEEISDAINSPVVVHYPGRPIDRPWFSQCTSRRRDDYSKCKMTSPWKDDLLMPNPKSDSGFRNSFSEFIHSLETRSSLYPILVIINKIRDLIGPILRILRLFPTLPKEGIEN